MSPTSRRRRAAETWPKPVGSRHAACRFCDALHVAEPVAEGLAAHCTRCGTTLYQNRPASLVRATAFGLAALVVMVLAHAFPFLIMDAAGMRSKLTLVGAARALIDQDSSVLGVSVILFTVVTPLVLAGGLVYVSLPLLLGCAAPGAVVVAKWMYRSEPWNMVEVFMLGVIVSLLKLIKVADVEFGAGFWSFGMLMVLMAAAVAGIDREELWDRIEVARSGEAAGTHSS
jgi:paraquat-inducible protein A